MTELTPAREWLQSHFGELDLEAREDSFREIANLTALRRTSGNEFYLSNFWRGPLLFALVARHRPHHVLEIGTGRGYGAMCMAMAADVLGLDTRIHTIDVIAPDVRQEWPLDAGDGPVLANLAIREVWKSFPAEWVERIDLVTGASTACLKSWLDDANPPIDLAFIDGGHDYWIVRHDLLASLLAGRGHSVSLLLDDYGGVQGQAVRRIVDELVSPALPSSALARLAMPQSPAEVADNGEHGMVYIDGSVVEVNPAVLGQSATDTAALGRLRLAAEAEHYLLRARGQIGRARRQLLGR